MITIKSHHFVYTFIAQLAAKCCCGRQVNKWRTAANDVALLSTVGNVAHEKNVRGVWRAVVKWSVGRSLVTPALGHGKSCSEMLGEVSGIFRLSEAHLRLISTQTPPETWGIIFLKPWSSFVLSYTGGYSKWLSASDDGWTCCAFCMIFERQSKKQRCVT